MAPRRWHTPSNDAVVPVNGLLQEVHVRLGNVTPYYLDSKTTLFVANDDQAARKSVWLARRVAVVHEGVKFSEIEPHHVPERDMVADPFTKYLAHKVWSRHMDYLLNDRMHVAHWEK